MLCESRCFCVLCGMYVGCGWGKKFVYIRQKNQGSTPPQVSSFVEFLCSYMANV
jgi:hypothetical protein